MKTTPDLKKASNGDFPGDWGVVPIGDLFTFKNGLNKAKAYFGYGTPIVNYMDVYRKPALRSPDIEGLVDVTPQELGAYNVRKGDVLFTRTSETVEEVGMAAVMLDTLPDAVYSGFVLRGRPIDETLCDEFKAYCFSSRYFRQQVIARASYTTRALTNGRSLSAAQLAVPPLPEQHAIAAALSDVDALLDSLSRLIVKKRDIKQAIMQLLLTGKMRLPGFKGEWTPKQLAHAGRCLRGVTYRGDSDLSSHDTQNTKRLLRSNNVHDAKVNIDEVQFVNSSRVSPQQILKAHDILVCMANGSKALVGKSGLFKMDDGYDYTFGAFMGCFRTDPEIADPNFIFCLFQTGQFRNYINNLLAGSSINNLRPSSIESLEFKFPNIDEQAAIANFLADLEAEQAALVAKREKLLLIKLAMMQELLTGRTRLVPTEPIHA